MSNTKEHKRLKKGKEFHDLESKRLLSLQFFQTPIMELEPSEVHSLKDTMVEELRFIAKKIGSKSIFFSWGQMARNDVLYRWQFLSNMFPCEVVVDGITYPSTEHYFQLYPLLTGRDSADAQFAFAELLETKDPMIMRKLCKSQKKYGPLIRSFEPQKDDSIEDPLHRKALKLQTMEKAIRCKLEQYPLIQQMLRWSYQLGFDLVEIGAGARTAEEPKDEDIFWNKKKWRGNWYGMNMTGKIWMKLRDELCDTKAI